MINSQSSNHLIISCGDAIVAGSYLKHSCFSSVINLYDPNSERLISLVSSVIGAGPGNIEVCPPILDYYRQESVVSVEILPNFPANVRKVYCSKMEIESEKDWGCRVAEFKKLILSYAKCADSVYLLQDVGSGSDISALKRSTFDRTLLNHFVQGVALFFSSSWKEGVVVLAGLGGGLTPTGDDFLTGVMVGLRFIYLTRKETCFNPDKVGEMIFHLAQGPNLISTAQLFWASRGRVSITVKELLSALNQGPIERLSTAVDHLSTYGSSSGVDFMVGLCMTLERNDKLEFFYE